MKPEDFKFLVDFIKKRSGIVLTDDKQYLLDSRLLPIARSRNMADLGVLVAALRINPTPDLLLEVTEAMTTNESLFFRDGKPFEHMKQTIFPLLRQQAEARKHLRIWSGACSTGQEPYSVAITLLEEPGAPQGWRYEIVATDLAQKVVDKAMAGVYSQFEAQRGLPIQMLVKYFEPQQDTSWKIKSQLRNMIDFRLQNLLEKYTALGRFDFILCRNVLIYFDDATKADIISRMAEILNPGGVLMLGGTEAIIGTHAKLQPMENMRGVYQLK